MADDNTDPIEPETTIYVASGQRRRHHGLYRLPGGRIGVVRTLPTGAKDAGPSSSYVALTLAFALAAAVIVVMVYGRSFGIILAGAGIALMVISAALGALAFRGLRGSILSVWRAVLVWPLLVATLIAIYAPSAVLTDKDATWWEAGPVAGSDIPPTLVAQGEVIVGEEAAPAYLSALAWQRFTVADEANYRFVVTGTGEVSIRDQGGWQLVHDGKEILTNKPRTTTFCNEEETKNWDIDAGERGAKEQCTRHRGVNQHEFKLRADSPLEVFTPGALADPAHTKEIRINFGFGLIAINSATELEDSVDSPAPSTFPSPKDE